MSFFCLYLSGMTEKKAALDKDGLTEEKFEHYLSELSATYGKQKKY